MHNDNNVRLREKGLCGIVPKYEHAPVTLSGTPLASFRIVYPAAKRAFEKWIAEGLAELILDFAEVTVPAISDATPADGTPEILVGVTNRTATPLAAGIHACDKGIVLAGKTLYELGLARRALMSLIDAAVIRGDGRVELPAFTPLTARTETTVMSYNLYGFHAYQSRIDNICRIITKYLPDVISIQEPDLEMMALTHVNLDAYYSYYNGRPRHGEANDLPDAKGANSVAPILYNRERFRLLTGDTKWMSDTPDVPSKYASSTYYRHYTYIVLEDRESGARFVAVNLHLQRAVALEQTEIVFDELAWLYPKLPILLVGDFNSEADKPVIGFLRDVAGFASAHDTAHRIRDGHNRIDWILYSRDMAEASFYHCCTETYPDPDDKKGYYDGKTPSDHFAFYAELVIRPGVATGRDWSAVQSFVPPTQE